MSKADKQKTSPKFQWAYFCKRWRNQRSDACIGVYWCFSFQFFPCTIQLLSTLYECVLILIVGLAFRKYIRSVLNTFNSYWREINLSCSELFLYKCTEDLMYCCISQSTDTRIPLQGRNGMFLPKVLWGFWSQWVLNSYLN